MGLEAAAQSVDFGMSTVLKHIAFGKNAEEALKAVRAEAARLEKLLSCFLPGSDISRINRAAGKGCVRISEETCKVLSAAAEFSGYCGGIFDVTIGPLVALWKSARDSLNPPEAVKIREVLPLIHYTDLLMDPVKRTAGLLHAGQSIDLGGIGKGYVADRILEVFRYYGITSAYTNIGGNVAALGTKSDGMPWRIGIQHPRQEESLIGIISAEDQSVVTSGDYQRYFTGNDGMRYHHILDPATGYPARSGLISVTVVFHNSMAADALSTILFISGMEKGRELISRFQGAQAVFVDQDMQVHITGGLRECFRPAEGISVSVLD